MVKLQVLDINYKSNYDRTPIVTIFGNTEDGKSVNIDIMDTEPYFYVLPVGEYFDDVKNDILSMGLRVEEVKRFLPIGYQLEPTRMLKVYSVSPRDVRELRDQVRTSINGVREIFEADILYTNRFMADHNITGMSWIEVPKQCIDYNEIVRLDNMNDSPLKIMSIDLECLGPESGEFPKAENDPIILISLAFNTLYRNVKDLVIIAKDIVCDRPDTVSVGTEKELLMELRNIIREYDPDIITGYNIVEFDFPYIDARAKINNIGCNFSRNGAQWFIKNVAGKVDVTITGRVVIDTLPMVRNNFSLKEYKLKTVSKELLNFEKLDVDPKVMREYWFDKGDKFIEFIKYSRRDAVLGMMLLTDLGMLQKYIEISKLSGVLLQVAINDNQTPRIESLLLKEFIKENRVFPLRPPSNDNESDVKGAYVLDTVKGLHENIIICDFSSLYPSIIRAYNISWDTILNEDLDVEMITTPNGAHFVKHDKVHGIMPRILAKLYDERVATKKQMKAATDKALRDYYDSKQYAIKILLNSFYGYSGNTRARLFDERIANAITSVGRETILKTKDIVESMEFEI